MAKLPRRTIAEWRIFRFMNQAELAAAVGVDRASLSQWETGKRQPRATNMRKLAAALHVRPDQIVLLQPPTDEEE